MSKGEQRSMQRYRTPKQAWEVALRNLAASLSEDYPDMGVILDGLEYAFRTNRAGVLEAFRGIASSVQPKRPLD